MRRTKFTRCTAAKPNGERCKIKAYSGGKFCWHHDPANSNKRSSKIKSEGLTDKQRAFCEEYMIDLNATQAAIRAGYSDQTAKVQGSRLLTKVKVKEKIGRLKEERSKRVEINADKVLKELDRIGFADIKDFLSFRTEFTQVGVDKEGNPVFDYAPIIKMKDSKDVDGRAVSEVHLTDKGTLKFKLHDKIKALQEIGKHLGIPERHEHTGKDGGSIAIEKVMEDMTDEQQIAILKAISYNGASRGNGGYSKSP